MAGLMDGDGEQGWVGQRYPGVRSKRQEDGGLPDPPGLIPGEIGLPRSIELEVVDPAHRDFSLGGVGYSSETDANSGVLPPVQGLADEASHTRLISDGPALHNGYPKGDSATVG